ncbi:glutamine synthetase [Thelephora terrestris]|uniref:Glutamine synthetase n=1 Tax=Thelephora terrestris TaxID=56493 RepID=A0A9P6HEL8_9AGAM|nr:glutamine synthetase [Thelephora terrestris]
MPYRLDVSIEVASGEYEIVTGPLSPLQAVDALVFSREVIYNTANKHGLRATFAPKVFEQSAGSGAHTNIPIRSEMFRGQKSPKAPSLTPIESVFLRSVLDNLQAICAIPPPPPQLSCRIQKWEMSCGAVEPMYPGKQKTVRLRGPRVAGVPKNRSDVLVITSNYSTGNIPTGLQTPIALIFSIGQLVRFRLGYARARRSDPVLLDMSREQPLSWLSLPMLIPVRSSSHIDFRFPSLASLPK